MTSRKELETIGQIVTRWQNLVKNISGEWPDRLSATMDVDAAHKECPMDLGRLLGFPDGDFAHDMAGIERHINRTTSKLGGCFVPRCAA